MNKLDAEVDGFLGRYAATLTDFDSQAAASLWSTPGMILDDRFAGVLEDRDAIIRGLDRSYPLYRKLGLASVDYECLKVERLTDLITLIHVRWRFYDALGNRLTDSTAFYIVRRDNGDLQACVCVQVDDAEKIHTLATERGVDLSDISE